MQLFLNPHLLTINKGEIEDLAMATKARYYAYRNLNSGTFSVQFKSKVINHPTSFVLHDVKMSISISGQTRVRQTQVKNVHAKVSGVSIEYPEASSINESEMIEIYYDPYKVDTFIVKSTGEPIYELPVLYGKDNRIYTPKSSLDGTVGQQSLLN